MRLKPSKGLQDFAVTVFARGGAMFFSLATQSVLAWMLGRSGRGEYALCLIFSNLSSAILILGMDWSCNYYISSKKISLNQTVSIAIVNGLVMTILALALLPMLKLLPIEFFQKIGSLSYSASIAWAISLIGFSFAAQIMTGLKCFTHLAILSLSKVCFTFIATAGLLYMTDLEVAAPIFADTASGFLSVLFVLIFVVAKYKYRFELPKFDAVRQFMGYGARFFGGSFGMIANTRLGTILLAFYVEKEQLGIFAQAMAFSALFTTLADMACRIIQPRVASSVNGRPELVISAARIIGLVVLSSGCIFLLFADYLIPVLFSPEFTPMIPLLFILMPGIWIRVIAKTLFPYFNGTNRPGVVSQATIVNLVVNLVLLMVLVEPYGLAGASWATSIAYFVSSAFIFYKINSLTHVNYFKILLPQYSDVGELMRHLNIRRKGESKVSEEMSHAKNS
ncbi:oligosaccharide flippase family protein [Planctomycetota bacterium]|nr:oligosaccharide flippase family protein [Planctomycetota bacterium]